MDVGAATPLETPKVELPVRTDDSLAAEEVSGGLLGALRPCGIADVAMVLPPLLWTAFHRTTSPNRAEMSGPEM
jgi:hypothetical protein